MSELDLDALLLHRDFVRDLARSLLGDSHLAADAEQNTWVALMRGGPDDPGSVRAWLGAVVRNFAFKEMRGAGRRRARELAVASREATASTEDLVEREQVRRKVVAAVLSLNEPFRSAVVFRYFEDLPPREIAARTGVSVNTVQSRLRLAREKLRRRLDDEHHGDRALWATPLLGLLGSSTGVLLMTVKMKALLAVAAVVVFLAGTAWWQGSRPGLSPERDGDGGAPPALVNLDSSDGNSESAEAGHDSAAAGTGRIEGKIPDGAGERTVRVVLVFPNGTKVEAKPGATGEFSFPDLPAGTTFLVRAEAEGLAPAISPGLVVQAERATRARLPEFRLAVPLRVTVRSTTGQLLERAAVAAIHGMHGSGSRELFRAPASFRSVTGPDGRIEFPELGAGWWMIEVRKDGYARTLDLVELYASDRLHEQEIRLAPGHRLSGRVGDSSGAPVRGAVVLAEPLPRLVGADHRLEGTVILRAAVNTEGEFLFTDLPAGLYEVKVLGPDRAKGDQVQVRVPGPDRIDLVLESAEHGAVEGTVSDATTGEPIGNAAVVIAGLAAWTDSRGRYRRGGVPVGRQTPRVSAVGYCGVPPGELTVLAKQVVTADFSLSRGAMVVGRVSSADGPVADAQVQILPVGLPRGRNRQTSRTDGEGRYRISGLQSGRHIVQAFAPGYFLSGGATNIFTVLDAKERHFVELPSSGEVTHDITLGRTVTVSGQVVDPRGVGLPGVTVERSQWSWPVPGSRTVTDRAGQFVLPGVDPERGSELILSHPGYGTEADRIHVRAPKGGDPIVIEMRPLAHVSGEVKTADGSPFPGARVAIRSCSGPGASAGGATPPPVQAFCDNDGRYSARAPATTGWFEIYATAPGHGPARSVPVRIEAGVDEVEVSLVLNPAYTVSGRVVHAGTGEGVAGARIHSRLGSGSEVPSGPICAVSDSEGRFTVSGLRGGRTEFGAISDGFARTYPTVVSIPAPGEVRVELSPAVSIEGALVDEDGSPVEGAMVAAFMVGRPTTIMKYRSDTTRADGSFSIDGLTAGDYRLEISGAAIPMTKVERVTAGSKSMRITVSRGGEIAGQVVDDEGRGIAGCSVNARPSKHPTDIALWKHAEVDADGRFRFLGLEDDVYTVSITPPSVGMYPAYLRDSRDNVSPGTTDLEFVLVRTHRIEGRIRDEAGRPVTVGEIMLEPLDDRPSQSAFGLFSNGSFSIGGLKAGKYRLVHRAVDASQGLVLIGGAEIPAGTKDLELIGSPGKTLTGRVVDGEGKPVADARVTVTPHGRSDERITTSKADGTFRIQGLLPDSEWRLFVTAKDRRRCRIDYIVAGTKGIRAIVR